MKSILYLSIFTIFIGCNKANRRKSGHAESHQRINMVSFQAIIDSAHLKGSILIYDQQLSIFYSNDFERCDKGFLPASTFKIPNSIIALETGIILTDSTVLKWDGKKRRLPAWEQDMLFRDAFHVSCVPCYQEIARKVGFNRMKEWLVKLDYGEMVFDSSSIDLFWLQGPSRISQMQQVDFLMRFYNSQLPISDRTENLMKRLMIMESNGYYKLSGKTGWAIRHGQNTGWFTGYLETRNKVYFFATNIEPDTAFKMDMFPRIRNEITLKAFEKLKIIDF